MANIQSNLNKIKNAVLGVDVRDSIHDGIKAINEEVENTTDRQVQLEGTFDELVINAGNSNAEVAAARVDSTGKSHGTLGKRLNNFDSQIKEKADLNDLDIERKRIDTLTTLPEGSTTADAELIDIRTSIDGIVYENAGNSVRNQVKNLVEDINDFTIKRDVIITPSLSNGYVNCINGTFGPWDDTTYQRTEYIRIPPFIEKIEINTHFNSEGDGGFAIYGANKNYITGGKEKSINVNNNYKFIAVTVWHNNFNEPISIKFIPKKPKTNDSKLQKIDISSIMENGYILSTNGVFDTFLNDSYFATKSFIEVPHNTKYIVTNCRHNTEGAAGYAIYNINREYLTGGKGCVIDVSSYLNEKIYLRITDYDEINKKHNDRYIYFVLPYDTEIDTQLKPFHEKIIGFVGDSITFGFDDDNNGKQLDKPWVDQVGELLDCAVINYGVSSASLMNNDKFTEEKQLLKVCDNFDDKIDYLVTMIGINDFYRGYNLGSFEDRTEESFYGCLHIYYKKMLEKYPAENNHKLIVMIYPHYDVKPNFDKWQKAMREVAQYYSLPIIDLSQIMGVSPYMDTNFKYWRSSEGGHSAHLTQLGANIVAKCIANYIFRMFKI